MYKNKDLFFIHRGFSMSPYEDVKTVISPLYYQVNKGVFTLGGRNTRTCKKIRLQLAKQT